LADPHLPAWPALDVECGAAPAVLAEMADRLALALDDLDVTAVDSEHDGRWRVFFITGPARDAAREALARAFPDGLTLVPVDVPDEGWAIKVQAALGPVQVGRIAVRPPWDAAAGAARPPSAGQDATGPADLTVIVIEPSMGFGTGHHQSTRLCLRLLQRLDLAGRHVLDVGTGSGVLAIAAARLGAAGAVAIDNDPDAVAAARDNTRRNGVEHLVEVRLADVGSLRDRVTRPDGERTDDPQAERADVVVANLTANVIRALRAPLVALVPPGGWFLAGGFTADQLPLVEEALAPLRVQVREDEDDWVGLALQRAPAHPSQA